MKTYKEIEEVVKTRELKEVLCDRCEKNTYNAPYSFSGTCFVMDFGYGSMFDGGGYEIELCDDCCKWLLNQLKTKKEI